MEMGFMELHTRMCLAAALMREPCGRRSNGHNRSRQGGLARRTARMVRP